MTRNSLTAIAGLIATLCLTAALDAAGAMIDETDIEDTQIATGRAEHEESIETYERLLCGSRRHLETFVRQTELNGEEHKPVFFGGKELATMVDTRTERECGFTDNGNGKGTKERRAKG